MKKALILADGRIADVVDKEFPVHPDLHWIDVPDDTRAQEDRYENGAVVKPVPPEPVKQTKVQEFLQRLEADPAKLDKLQAVIDQKA